MLQAQKTLQKGFTIIELLIVIAIIGILATLVLTNFQGAQAKGRDVVRESDINIIYQKLEEYHGENGGYPDGLLGPDVLPGIDAGALNDADDAGIAATFTMNTAQPTVTPTTDVEYYYAAYNCDADGAQTTVGATCESYIIGTFLERDDVPFTKEGLNNL